MSKLPALTALAALRAQPWAILPEYLQAAEDILARLADSTVLSALAVDGHTERHQATLEAMASLGQPLPGTQRAMLRDGVAILPVLGVIATRASQLGLSTPGVSQDALAADFRAAIASPDVREILLLVDSPGGMVAGLAETAGLFAASPKPVTAFVQGDSASAAYWLSSQAGEIVTAATAALGSIGVVCSVQRRVGPNRDGIVTHEIVSSGAPDKRADPSTEEGRVNIQAVVDAIEEEFVGAVARGRKVSVETVRRDFGRGGMLAGRAAVAAGMADRVDTLEATLTRLADRGRQTPSRKGDRQMADDVKTDAANPAEAAADAGAPVQGVSNPPPLIASADLVAAERARIGAILAAAQPGFQALAQLAVDKGWDAETFAATQAACEPAIRQAALGAFAGSMPKPVDTAPAAAAPQPATPEEKLKAEWNASEALRAEFGGQFEHFAAFRKAEAAGQVRHVRKAA